MGKVFAKRPGPAELEKLQHASFNYFLHETIPVNGLVIDKTEADWPASIAATGLALAVYPVGVERGHERKREPLTQWKVSTFDNLALKKWKHYGLARDEMLAHTHNPIAPWTICTRRRQATGAAQHYQGSAQPASVSR